MGNLFREYANLHKGGGLQNFTAFAALIIVVIIGGYYYRHAYFDIFNKYSGSEAAAAALENLPENAIILGADDGLLYHSLAAQMRTKTIYNLQTEKPASYTKIGYLENFSATYEEFKTIVKRMFPDAKEVWITNTFWLDKNDQEKYLSDENLYYTDRDEKIYTNEHYSIYHVKLQ